MFPTPDIPDDWSPEQALAVYLFIDGLRERIGNLYQEQIIEQFRIDCNGDDPDDTQLELTLDPFDDDLSF